MLERYGDIWEAAIEDGADAVIITTNGFVKKNGEAVMGRGIAKEAKDRFPELASWLGEYLNAYGNKPYIFWSFAWNFKPSIITMPVKPIRGPSGEPGWKAKADIELIKNSAKQIPSMLVGYFPMNKIYMPRPGCGNGGLKWEDVEPVIKPYLDDRFVVFHKD
jgi:hypothetical protein